MISHFFGQPNALIGRDSTAKSQQQVASSKSQGTSKNKETKKRRVRLHWPSNVPRTAGATSGIPSRLGTPSALEQLPKTAKALLGRLRTSPLTLLSLAPSPLLGHPSPPSDLLPACSSPIVQIAVRAIVPTAADKALSAWLVVVVVAPGLMEPKKNIFRGAVVKQY